MNDDTFLTIAELALALIGFAALVAAFQQSRDNSSIFLRFSVRLLVEIALCAFGLSLLPVLLGSFGVAGAALWTTSSLLGVALVGWHVIYSSRRSRRVRFGHGSSLRLPKITALSVVLLAAINLTNASGLLWAPSVGPYLLLVIGQLGAACVFFVTAFFAISESQDPPA